jgi:predicted ATPase/DNA-binding CsgD family transcriptional regulator
LSTGAFQSNMDYSSAFAQSPDNHQEYRIIVNNPSDLPVLDPLSEREVVILRLLADGMSNREIAQKLVLSLETVKWYNKQIYSKLDVHSRGQAVAEGRQLGLLDGVGESQITAPLFASHSLPAQHTSFVGRERAIADVKQLLTTTRLVTLTGAGGTGKTRLSLQIANSMARTYGDGATFVTLASIDNPAQELGVIEQPNRSLIESLKHYLSLKHMLLVLDNYEHVLDAATVVTELLAAAPGVIILATSREVLRLSGEHEYLVPPLALPEPANLEAPSDLFVYESVILFSQRARAISSTFRLTKQNVSAIAGICIRLDGLPLAIELAAARIKLYNPQQLLERLDSRLRFLTSGPRDLPARQRTLRSTIDWSFDLLDEDEQLLFSRLAVFTGGRSIDAIEVVCGPGLSINAMDGVESLLNKSLLHQEDGPHGEPRFFMLETIHEYARERLAESGEGHEAKKRHLEYFLSLAQEMEPGYRRHNQLILFERTDAEIGNFRAAFHWAMENGEFEIDARLVSSLDYYLYYRDHGVEGYRWFSLLIDKMDGIRPEYQVRYLLGAGRLSWVNGNVSQSMHLWRETLVLARELGDRRSEAWALIRLSTSSIDKPDEYEAAVQQVEDGLEIFRELDHLPGIAQGLNIQGELARSAGDYAKAREVYEASLAACRETGEIYRQIMMQENLSYVCYEEADYQQAKDYAVTCMRQMIEIGAKFGALTALAALVGPLSKMGEPVKAARLLGASSAILDGMGLALHPSDLHEKTKYTEEVRSQLDEAAYEAARAEGQALSLEQALEYALTG